MRRTIAVAAAMTVALSAPAFAEPNDGDGIKTVESTFFEQPVWCEDTEVLMVYEEWSQRITSDQQTLLLVHVTRTYSVEDELPFFRFVSSYVDRSYQGSTGDAMASRAGLDEGFTGHLLINEFTGEETRSGQETLSPNEQACAALTR